MSIDTASLTHEQQLLAAIETARQALDNHRLTKPASLGFSLEDEDRFQAWITDYHRLYTAVLDAELNYFCLELGIAS